jgi:hypothetical protein
MHMNSDMDTLTQRHTHGRIDIRKHLSMNTGIDTGTDMRNRPSQTVKYGHESRANPDHEWLGWQWPAAVYHRDRHMYTDRNTQRQRHTQAKNMDGQTHTWTSHANQQSRGHRYETYMETHMHMDLDTWPDTQGHRDTL